MSAWDVASLESGDLVVVARADLPDRIPVRDYATVVLDIDSVLEFVGGLVDANDSAREPPRLIRAQYGSEFILWLAGAAASIGLVTAAAKAIESFASSYEKFEAARLSRAKRLGLESGSGNPYEDELALRNFKMEVARELLSEQLNPAHEAELPPERYFKVKPGELFEEHGTFHDGPLVFPPESVSEEAEPRILDFDEFRKNTSERPSDWSLATHHAFLGIVRLAESGIRITIERGDQRPQEGGTRPHAP